MLKKIIDEQRDFQRNFFDLDTMSEKDRVNFTKENILAAHRELSEILSAVPSKSWRVESTDYDIDHVKEEIIDAFKFLLNVAILWGIDDTELYDIFMAKSKVVRERFEKEFNSK